MNEAGFLFGWFGHLPGDICYRTEHTTVWIPWVSMLVVSVALSALMWVVRYLRGFTTNL